MISLSLSVASVFRVFLCLASVRETIATCWTEVTSGTVSNWIRLSQSQKVSYSGYTGPVGLLPPWQWQQDIIIPFLYSSPNKYLQNAMSSLLGLGGHTVMGSVKYLPLRSFQYRSRDKSFRKSEYLLCSSLCDTLQGHRESTQTLKWRCSQSKRGAQSWAWYMTCVLSKRCSSSERQWWGPVSDGTGFSEDSPW